MIKINDNYKVVPMNMASTLSDNEKLEHLIDCFLNEIDIQSSNNSSLRAIYVSGNSGSSAYKVTYKATTIWSETNSLYEFVLRCANDKYLMAMVSGGNLFEVMVAEASLNEARNIYISCADFEYSKCINNENDLRRLMVDLGYSVDEVDDLMKEWEKW